MDRLLIIGDPGLGMVAPLLEAFLEEGRSRQDVEVVAVCDCGPTPPLPAPLYSVVDGLRRGVKILFNPPLRGDRVQRAENLYHVARKHGVPVIVPPSRDINHPEFIAQLRHNWKPTLALSLGCMQIFGDKLLDVFEMAVNYHDGYLPHYKGLRATEWSLYRGEQRTGYTYHVMHRGIDTGPALVQDYVLVDPAAPASDIHREKLRRAILDAGKVLDLMVRRAEGTPQQERGSYFSSRDRRRICIIDDPSQHTAEDILRRLYAFGILTIKIRGRRYEVTALRKDRERSRRLSFKTSDGETLTAFRFMHLPLWLYWPYHLLKRRKAG